MLYDSTVDLSYGHYPYGNEPLFLPSDFNGLELEHNLIIDHHTSLWHLQKSDNRDQLYWFRWMIGHHISFIVWILVSKYLNGIIHDITKRYEEKIENCFDLLKLSVCMYIYSATTPEEVYISTIRKFMALYHASFSAKWAKDYVNMKCVIKTFCDNELRDNKKVKQLVSDSVSVHFTIAGKLVKDKKSLLQISSSKAEQEKSFNPKYSDVIYDNFFMVKRISNISEQDLINSLLKRCKILRSDIEVNGLFESSDQGVDILIKNTRVKNYIDSFYNILDKVINISV